MLYGVRIINKVCMTFPTPYSIYCEMSIRTMPGGNNTSSYFDIISNFILYCNKKIKKIVFLFCMTSSISKIKNNAKYIYSCMSYMLSSVRRMQKNFSFSFSKTILNPDEDTLCTLNLV